MLVVRNIFTNSYYDELILLYLCACAKVIIVYEDARNIYEPILYTRTRDMTWRKTFPVKHPKVHKDARWNNVKELQHFHV